MSQALLAFHCQNGSYLWMHAVLAKTDVYIPAGMEANSSYMHACYYCCTHTLPLNPYTTTYLTCVAGGHACSWTINLACLFLRPLLPLLVWWDVWCGCCRQSHYYCCFICAISSALLTGLPAATWAARYLCTSADDVSVCATTLHQHAGRPAECWRHLPRAGEACC
jgi:hypothetical protein